MEGRLHLSIGFGVLVRDSRDTTHISLLLSVLLAAVALHRTTSCYVLIQNQTWTTGQHPHLPPPCEVIYNCVHACQRFIAANKVMTDECNRKHDDDDVDDVFIMYVCHVCMYDVCMLCAYRPPCRVNDST